MDNMYFGQNMITKDLGNGVSEIKYSHWSFGSGLFWLALMFNGAMLALVFTWIVIPYTLPLLIPGLIFFILSPSNSFYINAWGVSKDKTMKNIIKFEDINSITNGNGPAFGHGNVTLITKTKPVILTSTLRGKYTYDMIVNAINEKSAYIRYK